MRPLQLATLLLFLILPVVTAHAQDGPSLDETIKYIINKVDAMAGYRHQGFRESYSIKQFTDGNMTLVSNFSSDPTFMPDGTLATKGGETLTSVTVPLRNLSSIVNIKINATDDIVLTFATSDGSPAITIKEVENGEVKWTRTGPMFRIDFHDKAEAQSVANAFKHAIELCGGKTDPFAPTPSQ